MIAKFGTLFVENINQGKDYKCKKTKARFKSRLVNTTKKNIKPIFKVIDIWAFNFKVMDNKI
jgi:hypothetical protein